MKVTIEGKELVIRMPIDPHTSKSGKSTVIASSDGNIPAGIEYDGKALIVGVNAYVKK